MGWKCNICTFDNDSGLACQICGNAKPSDENGWKCLVCTFDGNVGDTTFCQMCGSPKQQITIDSNITIHKELKSFKHENQILAEITSAIYSSPLVLSVKGTTSYICKEIALYSQDWWTWNPNCSEPSLIGTYKAYEHNEDNEILYHQIINGTFTLTALLTTPKEFTKWSAFLGGPVGAFWVGAKGQKWCVGKQQGKYNEFCLFGEKPNVSVNTEVYIMLIRDSNDWELYINGNLITSASCNRSECVKQKIYSVGSGYPNGDERWMGSVHSIMIRPGIWKDN